MEKRYYIKKTYPDGEVYYATDIHVMDAYLKFEKDVKVNNRGVFTDSDLTKFGWCTLIPLKSRCTIEFEEIKAKELFSIGIVEDNEYLVLNPYEEFNIVEKGCKMLEFSSLESAKKMYNKLELYNSNNSYIFRYYDTEMPEMRDIESNMRLNELRLYNKLNKIREDVGNDLSEDIENIMKKIKDKANIANSKLDKPDVITSEEIKEEYSIAIFHVDKNDWTFIDGAGLFRGVKRDINIFDNIEQVTKIHQHIKDDYDCPNYCIRILKRIDGEWFDYETGLSIQKINLLLKTIDFLKYKKITYKGVENDEISKITEIAKSLVNKNERAI